MDATYGVCIYVDGTKKIHKTFTSTAGKAASATAAAKLFDYNLVLAFIREAQYLSLGAGSPWGTPDVLIDDLLIYDRSLSATDVKALSTMANRVTDFGPNGGTGIAGLSSDKAQFTGKPSILLDLSGRRTTLGKPGLYIINGRKVLVK